RQELDAVGARQPARLHAREGGGRRPDGVHRLVQPLPLRREERRERPRDREGGGLRRAQRVRRRRTPALPAAYSHSIVDGGFDGMSSTTRSTAGTSLTIRDEIVSSRS